MSVNQESKKAVVEEIKGKLQNAQSAVVVDYRGLTVEEVNALRKLMREANVDYKIYKNTLMNLAV
ncbi:MAG: 50S ribosomal protein L10, partial [Epulopiscium sp.]|nr:50S ribosomal protein L10 [Candidatus Epulonipiscium sp.]